MADIQDMLVEGERTLGRYTVVILRHDPNQGRWSPSLMQLDTTVTNYRLLLRPFRKKYQPASIPQHYIHEIELAQVDHYHCVMMQLITKHFLYLMLATGKLDDLYNHLRAMTSPLSHLKFVENIPRQDIERLIRFFKEQPVAGIESSA